MKKKEYVWVSVVVAIITLFGFSLFPVSDCNAQSALEPYKIGFSGAVTGPPAVSYTPLSDGLRLYITDLNERGGINGRKISLTFEDTAGAGIKAGASVKRFAGEKVHLIVLSAPSGTYAPAFEEVRRADIPLLVMSIGPHETVPPKCERLIYGQIHGNAKNATEIIVRIIKEQLVSKEKMPVWGIAGIDIPVSRKGAETQGAVGEKFGMKTVVKIAPLGVMDYTPIAASMKDAGCNIVSTWGSGGLTVGLFKALNKMGYKGVLYINTPDPPEHFIEIMQENPSILFTNPNSIPLWADFPVDREIKAKAEKHGLKINSVVKTGWWYGMAVEEIFKRTGWPVTTEKLLNVLDHLDLDFGSAFPPIKYTTTDHQGPVYQNGWSWSPEEKRVVVTLPWYVSNAAGTDIKVLPKSVGFPKVKFE